LSNAEGGVLLSHRIFNSSGAIRLNSDPRGRSARYQAATKSLVCRLQRYFAGEKTEYPHCPGSRPLSQAFDTARMLSLRVILTTRADLYSENPIVTTQLHSRLNRKIWHGSQLRSRDTRRAAAADGGRNMPALQGYSWTRRFLSKTHSRLDEIAGHARA